ncbi:MAG TPA: tetratricopeptide repeat protein [Pyrinomonadaceae bacterium]|nr:tetratricopeptide repeat protein [Pyrinomonadaceae bacterium]
MGFTTWQQFVFSLVAVCLVSGASFAEVSAMIRHTPDTEALPVATPTPARQLPVFSGTYLIRGNEEFARGNFKEALVQYETCTRMDPRNKFCLYNAALSNHELGNFREAIELFTRAIRFDPDWAEAYAGRARSRTSLRDWTECARDFAAAIDSGQRIAENLGGRGQCLSRSADHVAAVAALDSAIELEPRASFLTARARSLNELGETARAQADLDRAQPNSENDPAYHVVRGDVAARSGRFATAIAAYDRAIILAPTLRPGQPLSDSKLPEIYHRKGRVYERQGRPMLAFEAYSTAIEMGGHADSQKAREAVYAKLSAQEKAIADRRMGRPSQTQTATAPAPRPTPTPVRPTQSPVPQRAAATPSRTPTPTSPSARSTARVTTQAPRATPGVPPANASATNDFDEAYQKAEDAAKRGDHKAVIAYATRAIQLLPRGQQSRVLEDVTLSIHVSMLLLRARAHAALNDHAASDADFEAATKGAMDGTDRHLAASNEILANSKIHGDLGALTLAGAEMDRALITCHRAVEIGNEWRVTANASQSSGSGGLRAGFLLVAAREICVDTHISRARAVANTPFFSGPEANRANQMERRRRAFRLKAIEILTEAIKFADRYARLYSERAKLYRLTGQASLAAADEAKAQELAGGN